MALKKLKPGATKKESIEMRTALPTRAEGAETKQEISLTKNTRTTPSSSPAPGMAITPSSLTPPNTPVKRSRYIPAAERRMVMLRDQNGCTYRDPKTGRVCGSKHGLQFDHKAPFSQGGPNTAENLTLRCGARNRYSAEQMGLFRPIEQE
jgi:hypothetical protein